MGPDCFRQGLCHGRRIAEAELEGGRPLESREQHLPAGALSSEPSQRVLGDAHLDVGGSKLAPELANLTDSQPAVVGEDGHRRSRQSIREVLDHGDLLGPNGRRSLLHVHSNKKTFGAHLPKVFECHSEEAFPTRNPPPMSPG